MRVLAYIRRASGVGGQLTWNDIASIHRILVLDEAEAVHKLDLSDLASAMGGEVVLDIGLGCYSKIPLVSELRAPSLILDR